MLLDEFQEGLVELGWVLPQAGVAAPGGGPVRSGDLLVQPPRQRDRDEDVLLTPTATATLVPIERVMYVMKDPALG